MNREKSRNTLWIAVIGGVIVAAILIVGTFLLGQSASHDTDAAVRSVSLLYLDELAGRREKVVSSNLKQTIEKAKIAIDLMGEDDISEISNLQAYQSRMKRLYGLEKFAFVDTEGRIYTSLGIEENISDYHFDYKNIDEAEISILNLDTPDKKVIIAIPVDIRAFDNINFCASFIEIDMDEMLEGVSLRSNEGDTTFCNIYTKDGIALSNTVLGGLAVEDNLLEALKRAEFDEGYSYERLVDNFKNGTKGEVSFTYEGIKETLSFVPVKGTDWFLTYLIREQVITNNISAISNRLIIRSFIQSAVTILVLILMFVFIIYQIRKNSKLEIEKERENAESRVKQEEMEEKISLQDRLLEEEKKRSQQDQMITAMAADYRSVYYIDLDNDEGICYRSDPADPEQTPEGIHFSFSERFKWYADNNVAEKYREGFIDFIKPENIKKSLEKEPIIAYRYLAKRAGREYYEMIRMASVKHSGDGSETNDNAVGLGFTVIDSEMRRSLEQQQVLSDALTSAEQANRAKTAFLSNVSHEIRTPMNAIIGLDSIALNDPDTPPKTREYLEKIGTSAEHLLGLINDILDMSRIESGRMVIKSEEFSFSKLIESINTMINGQCEGKGLDYKCTINGHVDDYYVGDSTKLRQVIINILGNAVKFTPVGGKVELDIERLAEFDRKTTLQFKISDTGIGMSKEFIPHVFDTFSQEDPSATNKYGSSGLGLAITKNIVEMMNGNIHVESEKGKGSTFTVTVTLGDSDKKDGEKETEINPHEMMVLVVDDDPVACEHAHLVLEKAGIVSETAGSGEEAIEMVKLRHARQEPYNLILVDWQMPGLDGVETTKRIRSIVGDESAIIILTAYKWDDIFDEAIKAGVDSFVSKPLFASNVMEEFKEAVRRKTSDTGKTKTELSGIRILLAEDVQINAELMIMMLSTRDINVDVAENGRIAVDKFNASPDGYYSAVLMDMRMPEMDGLEATKAIRRLEGRKDAKTIPIIALTANAFDEDVQRSLQAGLNAHLSKPIKPDILFETLENLVNK